MLRLPLPRSTTSTSETPMTSSIHQDTEPSTHTSLDLASTPSTCSQLLKRSIFSSQDTTEAETDDLLIKSSKKLSLLTIITMPAWFREDHPTTPLDQSEEMTASSPTLLSSSRTCLELTLELKAPEKDSGRDSTAGQASTCTRPSTPLTSTTTVPSTPQRSRE